MNPLSKTRIIQPGFAYQLVSRFVKFPLKSYFHFFPKSITQSEPLPHKPYSSYQQTKRPYSFFSLAAFTTIFGIVAASAVVAEEKSNKPIKIQSLSEIPKSHPKGTLFFVDLDETAIDFSVAFGDQLGSKTWRAYIKKVLGSKLHDLISLHLVQSAPTSTVETMTEQFFQDLQSQGILVCGLTARERVKWYDTPMSNVDEITHQQVKSVGVNFDEKQLKDLYPELESNSEYYKGIFFDNTIGGKGEFVNNLFVENSNRPPKIVFIDDKLSQVDGVVNSLNTLEIPNEGYHYTKSDEGVSTFNPLYANIQLYHFLDSKQVVSAEVAQSIADQHPDRNAQYYLDAALKKYKEIYPND